MKLVRSAVCTCLVASTLVVAPRVEEPPAPPSTTAVALTASTRPLTVDVPELIAHVEEFAALVDPLVPENVSTPGPGAAAAPVATAVPTIGYEIANAILWLPGKLLQAIMNPGALPLLTAPVIGPVINGVLFAVMLGSFALGYAVAAVITPIEFAILSVIEAVGGLFRAPLAALGATGAVAEPMSARPAVEAADPDAPTGAAGLDTDAVIEETRDESVKTDDTAAVEMDATEQSVVTEETLENESPVEDTTETEAESEEPETTADGTEEAATDETDDEPADETEKDRDAEDSDGDSDAEDSSRDSASDKPSEPSDKAETSEAA